MGLPSPTPLPQPWAFGLGAPLTWSWGTCVQVAQLPLSLKDNGWHHICIAWTTRDGLWSAYQDGELQGSGENLAAWHPIKPHGILILGQEQVRLRLVLGLDLLIVQMGRLRAREVRDLPKELES